MSPPVGDSKASHHSDDSSDSDAKVNMAATYWFGASYLFFYLCDTVANIPLVALGP